ncbi:MAG: DUF4175 family protein, partial [Paracoccaceae bacterium]|nr:DUF4175 family protein [Paracoccaceae bacterium]
MPDKDAQLALYRLRWPLRLTQAGLWAERLARAFWPLWSVLITVLALLAFEVQDHLPPVMAWAGLALAAAGAVWVLVAGLRSFRRPLRAEALARLDAALPGQPIAALGDHQAIGGADPASVAVW